MAAAMASPPFDDEPVGAADRALREMRLRLAREEDGAPPVAIVPEPPSDDATALADELAELRSRRQAGGQPVWERDAGGLRDALADLQDAAGRLAVQRDAAR
ncbi:MAG: hypothetical protein JWM71_2346, partial [Solirubrobacteraceae bacterium]|nr:hypothetical protein [Solirubrobacteraceae bacterium]